MSIQKFVARRSEVDIIRNHPSWVLVYGRRKTGKTFMLKNFLSWHTYITVSRGLSVLVERRGGGTKVVELRRLPSIIEDALERNEVVIVDEFQRLPEHFWDIIASCHPKGKLVLSGSSLSIVEKVFSHRSPLLGLLLPIRIDIIRPSDILFSLVSAGLTPRRAVEWGVIVRDPWVIPHVNLKGSVLDQVTRLLPFLVEASIGLIGEVFKDEERLLTRIYEAILYSIASGSWSLEEVARELYQKGIVEHPRLEYASSYVDRLSKMGLVEKVPLYKSRARIYLKLRSHLMSIAMGVEEKTGITEAMQPIFGIEETIRSIYGLELQFFVGEALAEATGLRRAYTILPRGEGDIDVVLLDRKNKPVMAVEVKSSAPKDADVTKLRERAEQIGAPETAIFTLRESREQRIRGVKIITPKVLIEMLRRRELVDTADYDTHEFPS
ncbi:MAG: AAA family ATPase [Candidatus Baldrarchaeia archaeon]